MRRVAGVWTVLGLAGGGMVWLFRVTDESLS